MKIENKNKKMYSTYFSEITQKEPKEYLLCHECELAFGKWESKLSRNITIPVYKNTQINQLVIDKETKLAILSFFWRILKKWTIDGKHGSLLEQDIERLKIIEKRWFNILKEKRDFNRDEANIFCIPLSCVKDNFAEIDSYKLYPGILSDVIYYDQGNGCGYFCIRCFAHRIIFFAYLTPAYTLPKNFSIHNKIIELQTEFMPQPILDAFINYSNHSKMINTKKR